MKHSRAETRSAPRRIGGLLCGVLLAAMGVASSSHAEPAAASAYQVDLTWPQPLPNKWLLGDVSGVSVDRQGHAWVIHRPRTIRQVDVLAGTNPPTAKCCVAAPPVLEFDPAGKLVRSWGGEELTKDWFDSEHAIFVDAEDNVWILGAGPQDGEILKFTKDGKQLLKIGRKGAFAAADDPTILGKPTDMYVDTKRREVFVSDGYRNHRVIVFNADTGAFKRQWTAFGNKVDPKYSTDQPEAAIGRQGNLDRFTIVHCVTMIEGEIHVCDRTNDRIQVFTPQGKYIRQIFFNQHMAGGIGSAWDAAPVPNHPDLILALDGTNSEIGLLDRHTGKVVASYLSKGRYAGQMHWPHQVAIDGEGRLYVAEVGGAARIQRFVPGSQTPH